MEKTLLIIGVAALVGAALFMMTPQSETVPQLTVQQNTEEVPPQVYDLFIDWKKKYDRKYASPTQDAYRLSIFNTNYKYIQNFYEGPEETFSLDFTQFMDITNEEFKASYLGLAYTPESKDLSLGTPMQVNEDVPNAVDWRQNNAVTPVKNQGQCGSCWSFSTTGALEGLSATNKKGLQSFSEQQLVDCDKTDGGCNGGLMENAFAWVAANGIVLESQYAYTARDGTCKINKGAFKNVGFTTVRNCDQLKSALANGPVSVAVDANNWQFYGTGVFSKCKTSLDHGVLAVGFDDSGNWIVKNSWGTGWGEQGYIRLAPGNTCGVCDMASQPTGVQ